MLKILSKEKHKIINCLLWTVKPYRFHWLRVVKQCVRFTLLINLSLTNSRLVLLLSFIVLTSTFYVMIVWVQSSIQHLGHFFHREVVDMIHEFFQIRLKERVKNQSSSDFKKRVLSKNEAFCQLVSTPTVGNLMTYLKVNK